MKTPDVLRHPEAERPKDLRSFTSFRMTHGEINFSELFENSNPLEIEIGCGKGKFLLARALECPEINFLGIDRVQKWMKIGIERSLKRKVENIKFVKEDARLVLENLMPGTVSVFHVYFPDPWPKRRHRSRRLVGEALLRLLHSRLRTEGFVEIATDDLDYFSEIKKASEKTKILWKNIRETVNRRLYSPLSKTNYELKYEAAGKNLYYLELQK